MSVPKDLSAPTRRAISAPTELTFISVDHWRYRAPINPLASRKDSKSNVMEYAINSKRRHQRDSGGYSDKERYYDLRNGSPGFGFTGIVD
jgi:hypothetical protein